jgi:hypothetical protein
MHKYVFTYCNNTRQYSDFCQCSGRLSISFRDCLREPSVMVRANLYLRLRELCLCTRLRTKDGTFSKRLREPSGKVAQSFGLALRKSAASCFANLCSRLRKRGLIPALPSDLVKNTSVQAPGARRFIKHEHGA